MQKQWVRAELPNGIYHVLPYRDLKEHEDGERCWCKPKVERYNNGNTLIVHNSADGREFYEGEGH